MYNKCIKSARTVYVERQIGDQRLTAERDLQNVRQRNQDLQQDFDYLTKLGNLQNAGQDTDTLKAAKASSDIFRNLDKDIIKLKRESEDQAQARQRTLEDFKKTKCKY